MCSTIVPNWVGFSWSWRHASYHPYSYYVHTSDSPVTFTDDSPLGQDYFMVVLTARKSPKVYCCRIYFRKLNSHSFYLKR
jgi:hypothetical protein